MAFQAITRGEGRESDMQTLPFLYPQLWTAPRILFDAGPLSFSAEKCFRQLQF